MSKEKTAADHSNTLTAKEITKKTPQLDSVKVPAVDPVKRFADKIHETFDPIEQSIAKLETRQQELNKQIIDTEGTYDVKEIHERTVAKSELGEVNTALENARDEYKKIKEDNAERLANVYRDSLAEMTAPLESAAEKAQAELDALEEKYTAMQDAARLAYSRGYQAIGPKLYTPFKHFFPEENGVYTIKAPSRRSRFEAKSYYSGAAASQSQSKATTGPVDPWGKPLNAPAGPVNPWGK